MIEIQIVHPYRKTTKQMSKQNKTKQNREKKKEGRKKNKGVEQYSNPAPSAFANFVSFT